MTLLSQMQSWVAWLYRGWVYCTGSKTILESTDGVVLGGRRTWDICLWLG